MGGGGTDSRSTAGAGGGSAEESGGCARCTRLVIKELERAARGQCGRGTGWAGPWRSAPHGTARRHRRRRLLCPALLFSAGLACPPPSPGRSSSTAPTMLPRRAQPPGRSGSVPPPLPVPVFTDASFRRAATNDAYAPATQAAAAHLHPPPPPSPSPSPHVQPSSAHVLVSPVRPCPPPAPASASSLPPASPPPPRPHAARERPSLPPGTSSAATTPAPMPLAPGLPTATLPSDGDSSRAARRRVRGSKPRPSRAASGWVPASMHPEVSGLGPEPARTGAGPAPAPAPADGLHPALAGLGGVRARSIRRANQQATPGSVAPSLGRRSTLRKQVSPDDWTPPEKYNIPDGHEGVPTPVRRPTLAEMDDPTFGPEWDDPDAFKAALGRTLSMRGNASTYPHSFGSNGQMLTFRSNGRCRCDARGH